MEVLVPIPITDAMLVSTTAPEDSTDVWAAGAFIIGEYCHRVETHRVYKRVTNGTDAGGEYPEDFPDRWQDYRPTNAMAMFDGEVSTQTVVASPLTVVLQPGFHNAIAFFGLEGTGIVVTDRDGPGGAIIFGPYEDSLDASDRGDWYDYWFAAFKPKTDLVLSGIAPFATSELTITITNAGGDAKCGMVAIGDLRSLGVTLRDPSPRAKPTSFSYVDIDEFGNNKIVRGKSAKDMSATVYYDVADGNRVADTMQELLDVPCAWLASIADKHRALRTFGLGSGDIAYEDPGCRLGVSVIGVI